MAKIQHMNLGFVQDGHCEERGRFSKFSLLDHKVTLENDHI